MPNTSISFLVGLIKNKFQTVTKISPVDEDKTEAVAYQIHSYYLAVEDIFKEIQKVFESDAKLNQVNYHKDMLRHVAVEMLKIRPQIISQAEYLFLELKLRHLFRHVYYNYQLDPRKVHDLEVLVINLVSV